MAKEVKKKRKTSAKAKSTKTKPVAKVVKKSVKQEPIHKNPVPGSFKLTAHVFKFIGKHWRPLGALLIVFLLLNIFFAGGLLSGISSTVSNIRKDGHSSFSEAVNGFGNLMTGSNGSDSSTTMQTVLLVINSLAIIWTLRHLMAGEKSTVKNAYYHAMAPLIPFLLISFLLILQILPLTIGAMTLSLFLSQAITASTIVTLLFVLAFIVLATWSVYMLSSSIFALYIVTLPNIQPMEALRSAKNLVARRRWQIIRRLLFLPFSLFVIMGIIIVPLIFLANFLTVAVFFILSGAAIMYIHAYLYTLYKELI